MTTTTDDQGGEDDHHHDDDRRTLTSVARPDHPIASFTPMDPTFRVLSFDFGFRSSVPGASERITELLAPFRTSGSGSPFHRFAVDRDAEVFVIRFDREIAHRTRRPGGVVDWILWKVSAEAIAGIDDHLAIHAGAVGWEGRSILLPAPHDSGKTTITAALTASGFSYLTDEAALIDPSSLTLVPFPRALWLEPGSVVALDRLLSGHTNGDVVARNGTSHVAPAELRGGRIGRPAPIRHIVFPRYRRGAATILVPMSRAEAVVELGRNAFNLDRFGRRGVDILIAVVAGADVHRLAVGDLREAVHAIERLVGSGDERRGRVSSGSG